MTRKEAVERLKGIKSLVDKYDDVVALREAIKALEKEPCEDAISRQAAVYIASGACHPANIADELAKLPPVTPKQRAGHWIMSDDGLYRPICNNCGAHPWKGYIPTVEEATKAFKYCPTCGIKMVEPQESEGSDADSD